MSATLVNCSIRALGATVAHHQRQQEGRSSSSCQHRAPCLPARHQLICKRSRLLRRLWQGGQQLQQQRGKLQVAAATASSRTATAISRTATVVPPTAEDSADSQKYLEWQHRQQYMDQAKVGFSFTHDPIPDGCWLEVVAGHLPPELEGTYFQNGPGQFRAGDEEYGHPLDGDGVVVSVAFQGGRAFFRSRFVETPELQAERAAGKILFRGAFAAERAGGWRDNLLNLYTKNASNTGVAMWGGSLFSLFEASLPYRLDPATLQTLGLDTLGGRLQPGLICAIEGAALSTLLTAAQRVVGDNHLLPPEWLQPGGHACTAHAYTCAATGRLCFFTYQYVITGDGLALSFTFWEVDPSSGAVHCQQDFIMPRGYFVHDFRLTPNYYVMFQTPTTIDLGAYLMGNRCAASCLSWLPDTPTYIHLIPRPGSAASRLAPYPRTLPMPTSFPLHQANAYEVPAPPAPVSPLHPSDDQFSSAAATNFVSNSPAAAGSHGTTEVGTEQQLPAAVVVDAIHYDTLPALGKQAFEQSPDPGASFLGRLRRARIDVATGDVSLSAPLSGHLEMPCIHPGMMGAPHRYVYGYTARPEALALALSKVDTATATAVTYCPPPCTFCGPPIFVARPGATAEDDGWLLAMAFNSETISSQLLVLDAQRVEDGPLAVLAVPHALPHGLHNIWTPEYFGPQPPSDAAWVPENFGLATPPHSMEP